MVKMAKLPSHLRLYDGVAPLYRTGKKARTRPKRVHLRPGPQFIDLPRSGHGLPKSMARALRRHPPTVCKTCKEPLFWSVSDARYVPNREDPYEAALADCPRPAQRNGFHTPANGKKRHRFEGHEGGSL